MATLIASAGFCPAARAFDLPCAPDDVLSETAAELLLSNQPITAAALLPKARALGFDGVSIQAHEGADEAALITWLKTQTERADGTLTCGEARSEARRLVLVSVRGGRLSLKQGKLFGKLAPGFRAPHLVLEDEEGITRRIELKGNQLASGVALPTEASIKRVQLVAEGPSGPRPVAELSFVKETAPAPATTPSGEENSAPRGRPRELLFSRLTAFRREQGVSGLRQNQLLDTSAQRHAQRVCELGKVAHRIGQGSDPESRLREEHIEARSVGEAIARAGTADAALEAIFESPSHRLAVTQKGFTDAGIGQAFDGKGHTCMVVLLAAWPRRIP